LIADVAPLNAPDGTLNAGDIAVLTRAVMGSVTLPPVEINDEPPQITTPSGSTTDNPFTINGTATPDIAVRLYVNGNLQAGTNSDPATGAYSFQAALYDGSNFIYTTTWGGVFESQPSQTITIDYTNNLNRNIGGSGRISADTVWTPGSPAEPYTITKIINVDPGVTLTVMPGTELQFKPDTGLEVEGRLVIMGETGSPVLVKGNASVDPSNRWLGIKTLPGADGINVDHAQFELSRYGIVATEGEISITNSAFQDIDDPQSPQVDVDVIGIHGNVSSALIANNQLSGSITGSDYLSGIHVTNVDAEISGNTIDGYDFGIRIGSGASPSVGPDNEIINNRYGIKIETTPGSNADPQPVIFRNSIYSNNYNLYATDGMDDPANWRLDARSNWWGTNDPAVIATTITDYSDSNSAYEDTVPSVDFTRFLDAPDGNEDTGEYIFGRITADTTVPAGMQFVVIGKLAVAPGVNLSVQEGVTFEFVPDASVQAYGNLSAIGIPGQPVIFSGVSWDTSLEWKGIFAKDGTYTVLSNVEIERSSAGGVTLPSGMIEGSYIHNNGYGIYIFYEAGLLASEEVSVINSRIEYNNTSGSSGANNSGIYVVGLNQTGCTTCSPVPTITGNLISGHSKGVNFSYGAGNLRENSISNNTYGIYQYSYQPSKALWIGDQNDRPYGNDIIGNNVGIEITGTGHTAGPAFDTPNIKYNNIVNNSLYNLEIILSGSYSYYSTEKAEYNWWGVVTSSEIADTIHDELPNTPNFDYSPWYTSGPAFHRPFIDLYSSDLTGSSLMLAGIAGPFQEVDVYINSLLQGTATADTNGFFSLALQLAAGTNQIYAIAREGTEESYPSSTISIEFLPSVLPEIPVLNPVHSETESNPFPISGYAKADTTVNIYVNGSYQASTTTDNDGIFSYLAALQDGQNSITASSVIGGSETAHSSPPVVVTYTNTIPRTQSGTLTVPTVWTAGNGDPYVITSTLTISPSATLTIEECAVIELSPGTQLRVQGVLSVNGESSNMVQFTSQNGVQAKEQWNSIEVENGGIANIDHALIEYGNTGVWFNGGGGSVTNSTIRVNKYGIYTQDNGTSVRIKGNTIENNEYGILVSRLSSPQITERNSIINNLKYGVYAYGTSTAGEDPMPVVRENNLYGNGLYDYAAVNFYDLGIVLDAGGNWWSTTDTQTIDAQIFDINDNASISPTVAYLPIQQVLIESDHPLQPTVDQGISLTNQPVYTVTGAAEPGRSIQLYTNGQLAGTTTADASDGSFSVSGTLSEGANTLAVTTSNGTVESIPSDTLNVVLDTIPPVITLTHPTDGALVNYATFIGQLDEPGVITVAAESVATNPDNSFALALAGLSDGGHTFQVDATDLAGNSTISNASSVSVSFTLDSEPPAIPDTSQIDVGDSTGGISSISAPVGSATSGDTVSLTNSRTGESVQVLVAADGSYSTTIGSQDGDEIVILINDPAGNTTASRILQVAGTAPAVSLSLIPSLDGSTVDEDHVAVSGTFTGPANVGITVNGTTAQIIGNTFCAGDVLLDNGANTLTVTAMAPDGSTSSQSPIVTSTGSSPVELEVDQETGFAPHTATFSLTDNTGATLTTIEYDVDGNGTPDYTTSDPAATIQHTYTTPGCYIATVTATDDAAGAYIGRRTVVVLDAKKQVGGLQGVYYRMLEALRNGDIPAAKNYFAATSQDKYETIFTAMQAGLSSIVDSLGTIAQTQAGNDLAEITVKREKDGIPYLYTINLIRGESGMWRIEGM